MVVLSTSLQPLPLDCLDLPLPVTCCLRLVLLSDLVPVQTVCQLPQTVFVNPVCGSNPPNLLSAVRVTSSKLPSVSNTFGSSLTVLTHVSVSYTHLTLPTR